MGMCKLLVGGVCLASLFLLSASAAPIDQLVVFGDSLSDTGNAAIAVGSQFPANYSNGRLTDGPNTTPATNGPIGVWVDQLAGKLGVPDPQPFLAGTGGTDYAVAGAKTGSNGLYGISDQVTAFTTAHPTGLGPNALYTIWGGANDLTLGGNSPMGAADALAANIKTLAAAGAKNFLWTDLPPIGLTPLGLGSGQSAALNSASILFNNEWRIDIASLQSQGINVIGVDIYSAFLAINSNPSAYGFSNATTPAQGLANVDPNTYVFWDTEHPTTAGQAVVANIAYQDLTGSTAPEPASLWITAAGLGGLAIAARRRVGLRLRK